MGRREAPGEQSQAVPLGRPRPLLPLSCPLKRSCNTMGTYQGPDLWDIRGGWAPKGAQLLSLGVLIGGDSSIVLPASVGKILSLCLRPGFPAPAPTRPCPPWLARLAPGVIT